MTGSPFTPKSRPTDRMRAALDRLIEDHGGDTETLRLVLDEGVARPTIQALERHGFVAHRLTTGGEARFALKATGLVHMTKATEAGRRLHAGELGREGDL